MDFLAEFARRRPDEIALAGAGPACTWEELYDRVRILGAGLLREGCRALGLCMANSTSCLEFVNAARLAQIPVVPLNPKLHIEELQRMAVAAGVSLLLCGEPLELDGVRCLGPQEWSALAATSRLPEPEEPVALVRIAHTSGSTGTPQLVRKTYDLPGHGAEMAAVFGLPAKGRHLAMGPLHHSAPFTFACTSLARGKPVVTEPFSARAFVERCLQDRITDTFSAPTMVRRVLDVLRPGVELRLESWVIGGGPFPTELKRAALGRLGPVLYELYGSTEAGLIAAAGPEDMARRPDAVGRVRNAIEVRIERIDGGASNGTGRIVVMRGGRAVPTGDIGSIDGEGYLTIHGRVSELIVSGGVNIYAPEVEAAVRSHPGVVDAAVFGEPDPEWGEIVSAFVVARQPLTEPDVRDWLMRRIGRFKIPRRIRFVDALPRDEMGKLRRQELGVQA